MSTAFCEETRQAFQGVITKPALTDKLLSRPPFRFLHDIVKATTAATGFLDGYFTADELDAEKVAADKDVKLAFLQKLITAVSDAAGGNSVDVQAKAVAGGKEPEKTNWLLQTLAQCAKGSDADSNQALLNRLKGGGKLSDSGSSAGSNKENRVTTNGVEPSPEADGEAAEPPKKTKEKKDRHSKDKEHSEKRHRSREKDGEKKDKEKSRSSKDKDEKKKDRHSSKDKDKEKDKSKDRHKEKDKNKDKERHKDKEKSRSKDRSHKSSRHKEPSTTTAEDLPPPTEPTELPLPAQEEPPIAHRAPIPPAVRPGSSLGARPGTALARPAPPKMKRKDLGEAGITANSTQLQRQNATAQSGSGDTAEAETANLILPDLQAGKEGNEEEDFVVEEEQLLGGGLPLTTTADADELDSAEHGGLVRKILETKKELESGLKKDEGGDGKLTVVFDEKERERTRVEAAGLQAQIQKLTRSAHPLGRLLDYLQEDVDSMLKELDQWREESRQNAGRLQTAMLGLQTGVDPYRIRLTELDQQIGDTRDAIAATRAAVLANEKHLDGLISGVSR